MRIKPCSIGAKSPCTCVAPRASLQSWVGSVLVVYTGYVEASRRKDSKKAQALQETLLSLPNARPILIRDLGESRHPSPLKEKGLTKGLGWQALSNKAPWNSPDPQKDPVGCPSSLRVLRARSDGGPKDVTGRASTPPPARFSFPPFTVTRRQRSLTHSRALQSIRRVPNMAAVKLLSSWQRFCAPARGSGGPWSKVKVRVRRTPEECRRNPECCLRFLLCGHRPPQPGSWHPWRRTPGTGML